MSFKPIAIPTTKKEIVEDAQVIRIDEAQGQKKKGFFNKWQATEDALNDLYEFRRNLVTGVPEIKYRFPQKYQPKDWTRVDDDILCSIERRMQLDGFFYATDAKILKIIKSDFAPSFHPIKDYFMSLPTHDAKADYIGEFVKTVSVEGKSEHFYNFFKKYITGVVANVFVENNCANHLCLVLAGGQGAYKSTWLRLLYPRQLALNYCYEGTIDPEDKDTLARSAENLYINMDDYFSDINGRKVNAVKGFITLPQAKFRRIFTRIDKPYPKICSFLGSTNEDNFLIDDSGSRRFLVAKVKKIDIEAAKKIDIDKVYAQAFYMFKNEFTWWITKEEQKLLEGANSTFKVQTQEFESLNYYLRPAEMAESAPIWYATTTQVLNYINGLTTGFKCGKKKIGQALKASGFVQSKRRVGGTSMQVWACVKEETNFQNAPIINDDDD